MKTISAALKAHYAQETTTIATCWKCTLKSGTIYGFTDASSDLLIAGVTYSASTGFSPSAVQTSSAFNVDNLEVQGALNSSVILETDLIAGLWDYASVSIFEVNYMDLTMGTNPIRDGFLGQVGTVRNQFTVEIRGLLQFYQQPIGRTFGLACDADFGDSRCTIALSTWTSTGTVISVASGRIINCTFVHPSFTYAGGRITMTSGAANGFSMNVRDNPSSSQIVLEELFPYAVVGGDTFSISAGCDKQKTTCADYYSNVVNFRGFPVMPLQDRIISGK